MDARECWIKTFLLEDLPDGGGRDLDAQHGELSVDPRDTPSRGSTSRARTISSCSPAMRVWGEIELTDPGEVGWRTAAATMAGNLYAMATRHPWLVTAMSTHLIYGPSKARYDDHCLAVYEAAGFTGMDVDDANMTVFVFVLGRAVGEAAVPATTACGAYFDRGQTRPTWSSWVSGGTIARERRRRRQRGRPRSRRARGGSR
jgi:hypothetical protein